MSFKRALSVAVFSAVVMTGIAANAADPVPAKTETGVTAATGTVQTVQPTAKEHGATVSKDAKHGAASVITPTPQKDKKAEVKGDAHKTEALKAETKTEVKPEAKTEAAPVKTEAAPVKAN